MKLILIIHLSPIEILRIIRGDSKSEENFHQKLSTKLGKLQRRGNASYSSVNISEAFTKNLLETDDFHYFSKKKHIHYSNT